MAKRLRDVVIAILALQIMILLLPTVRTYEKEKIKTNGYTETRETDTQTASVIEMIRSYDDLDNEYKHAENEKGKRLKSIASEMLFFLTAGVLFGGVALGSAILCRDNKLEFSVVVLGTVLLAALPLIAMSGLQSIIEVNSDSRRETGLTTLGIIQLLLGLGGMGCGIPALSMWSSPAKESSAKPAPPDNPEPALKKPGMTEAEYYRIRAKNCPGCGVNLESDAEFCHNCGRRIRNV